MSIKVTKFNQHKTPEYSVLECFEGLSLSVMLKNYNKDICM